MTPAPKRLRTGRHIGTAALALAAAALVLVASSTYTPDPVQPHPGFLPDPEKAVSLSCSSAYSYKWPDAGGGVSQTSYLINNQFGFSGQSAIKFASGAWSGVTSNFNIIAPSGTSSVAFNTHTGGDGINAVTLQNIGFLPGCIDFAACTGTLATSTEIIESDIAMDQFYYGQSVDDSCPTNPNSSVYYFRTLMLHEFGHFSGFAHNSYFGSPMKGTIFQGECYSGLASQDRDCVRDKYAPDDDGGGGCGGDGGGCRVATSGLAASVPEGVIPLLFATDYTTFGGVWKTLNEEEASALAQSLLWEIDHLADTHDDVYAALNGYLSKHDPFLTSQGDTYLAAQSAIAQNQSLASNQSLFYSGADVYEAEEVLDTRKLFATVASYASDDLRYVLGVLNQRLKVRGAGSTMYEVLNDLDDDNGSASSARADEVAQEAPSAFPNPFRSSALVKYSLSQAAHVRIAVYDALGREVEVLADGHEEPGTHYARFRADGLASGTYLCRVTVGEQTHTLRLQHVEG